MQAPFLEEMANMLVSRENIFDQENISSLCSNPRSIGKHRRTSQEENYEFSGGSFCDTNSGSKRRALASITNQVLTKNKSLSSNKANISGHSMRNTSLHHSSLSIVSLNIVVWYTSGICKQAVKFKHSFYYLSPLFSWKYSPISFYPLLPAMTVLRVLTAVEHSSFNPFVRQSALPAADVAVNSGWIQLHPRLTALELLSHQVRGYGACV